MLNKQSFVNIMVAVGLFIAIIIFFLWSTRGEFYGTDDLDIAPPSRLNTAEVLEGNVMDDKDEIKDDEMDDGNEGEDVMDDDKEMEEGEMVSAAGFFKDYVSMDMLADGPENKVLFFHASWCPSCRALEGDLGKNVIPDGLGVYKINYDTSLELKKKYGVTSQHTLVQVDGEGNMITKWLGGNDIDSIVRKLN